MPYPVGMVTRTVTFPAFFSTGGSPVRAVVSVLSERSFVWDATGEVFLRYPVEAEGTGAPVNIVLPVPDQSGMSDGAGNAISGWTYTATYRLSGGTEPPEKTTFELPASGSPLVIDPDISAQVSGGIVNTFTPVQGEQGPPGPPGAGGTWGTITGTLTDQTDLYNELLGKASATHQHTMAGVTGLDAALAAKAPLTHTHAQADVTNLTSDLALKAPLASPAFTGNPTAPTPATSDNDTSVATTAMVQARLAQIVGGAPAGLDTLAEIATSINNDTAFSTTMTTALAGKAATAHTHAAADVTSGVFPIARLATGTPDGTKFVRDDGTLAVPAGGGGGVTPPFLFPRASGGLLSTAYASTGSSGASSTNYPSPIWVPKALTIDAFCFRIPTLEAGALVGVALYDSDADGHPTNRVALIEGVDCSTSGNKTAVLGATVDLSAGLYWAFLRTSSPGSVVRYQAVSPTLRTTLHAVDDGIYTPGATTRSVQVPTVGAYGATVATITAWSYGDPGSTAIPWIALRRA